MPDSARIDEGKFDTVDGREVLLTTGRYGFKSYDVSDPESPQLLHAFEPAEIPARTAAGRTRTWTSTSGAS